MKKYYFFILLAIVLVACSTTSPTVNPTDQPAQLQPTQAEVQAVTGIAPAAPAEITTDGAALLDSRCAECHSANKAKQSPRSRDKWDQTVSRMIGKGAQLTDAEKQVLVDYLAANFGK